MMQLLIFLINTSCGGFSKCGAGGGVSECGTGGHVDVDCGFVAGCGWVNVRVFR